MKRQMLIATTLLILLPVLAYGFTRQWHTHFDGATGNNPDLPDWSEYYIGPCGTEHRLSGGVVQMRGGTSDECFGAYYREKDTFPGTFPTNQDMRVMWRFQYTELEHMGTQAGQVTGRFGAPQYYGISGVDSSVANFYHVETSGAWGTRDVNNPLWSSQSEDAWHVATFDFLCDGQHMDWWMDGGNIHQVTNGPVLPPNDDGRPSQFWFGNLLTTGGANRDWTDFEIDWLYIYAVERPQMNTPIPGSGGTQAVNWNAVSNTQQPDGSTWGIEYQARACTDTVCSNVVNISSWGSSLNHTFTNLSLNQTYYYQARARWVGTPELITCWGNTQAAAMSGSPALSLAKSAPSSIGPGDIINYSLIVQNTGSGPATGVVVRDPIPQYIQNPTNISSGGSTQGNEIVWNVGTLNGGQSQTLTWQGTVDPSIPNNVSQITNNASVTDNDGNNDNATATTTLLSSGIAISKDAPSQVSPGDQIDYSITVQNTGPTTLFNLTVRDPIPSDVINPTNLSNGGSIQGSEIVWQISSLSVGNSQTLSWRGTANPAMAGSVTSVNNTVSVQDGNGNSDNATATTAIVRPGIVIAKTATNSASPGETIDYTITVQNTGQTVLSNVVVEDPIPQYIQNPTNISNGGSASSSQITWQLGNLNIGDSRTLSWQGTVDPAIPVGTSSIRNIVTVRDDDGNSATDQADTTINNPSLDVNKTATNQVAPGNSILYQITVQNDGDVVLNNITIRDPIPQYILNPTNISAGGALQNRDIVWTISNLDIGESQTVTWQGTVDPAIPTTETEITNVATACNQGNRCDNDGAVTNLFAAEVEIEKSATPYGWPGSSVNYTIHLHNTSQVTLTNVVVIDPVPTDIFYPRNISNAGQPLTSPFEGKIEIVWRLGNLGPGSQLDLTWTGTVDPDLSNSAFALNNVARVSTDEGLYREAEASTYIFQPEISFEKTATISAGPGETIQYILTIENPNEAPLFDLIIVDVIPDYILNPTNISSGGTAQADEIRWQVAQLDPHQQTTLTWQGTVDPHISDRETEIKNIATVTDMTGQTVSAEAITDLLSQDLSLIKSATYTVSAGSLIDYAITIENTGQATLYDIEIVDVIPDAVINPANISNNGTLVGNTDIVWQIDQLPIGQSQTVRWLGMVDPDFTGNSIINRAAATTPSGLNETATAQSFLTTASFILNKQATIEAGPGETIQYTLILENPSPVPIYNLAVTDPIPPHIQAPANVSGGVIQADEITWQVPQLGSGQQIRLSWDGTVNPDLPLSISKIENTATATAGDKDASATASTNIRPQDLRLIKNASVSSSPGQIITYSLTVENPSSVTLYNLTIQDPIPQYVLQPTNISGDGQVQGNTDLVWQLRQLVAGQSVTLLWSGIVDPDIPASRRQIENTATANTVSGLTRSATAQTQINHGTYTLEKQATNEAGPGETVQYILILDNPSSATVYNITVTDPIPEAIINPSNVSGGGLIQATEITWVVPQLDPGQQITLSWQGVVDPHISTRTSQINNQASATSSVGPASDQASTTIRPQSLRLQKNASNSIVPIGIIDYQIIIDNPSQATIFDLEVRDPIPQYVLNPDNISNSGTFVGNTEIIWQLAQIAPSQQIILTWQGTVDPDIPSNQSQIINEATLTTSSGLSLEAQAKSYLGSPELTLTKQATVEAGPGEMVQYTLIVENTGSTPLNNVSVNDPIPDQIINPTNLNPSSEIRAEAVVWNLGVLNPGQQVVLTWESQVDPFVDPDLDQIINTATVSANDGALTDQAQAQTNLRPQQLQLHKSASYYIWPGQLMVYTVTVVNPGISTLYNLTVRDPIPLSSLVPETISNNGTFNGNREIVWQIPVLGPNQHLDLIWTGIIPTTVPRSQTTVINEAIATSGSGLQAEASVVSYLQFPTLGVFKTATASAGPGEVIDYTITVQNSSDIPAYGVTVRDPIPAEVINPANISTSGLIQGTEIIWPIGTLSPNTTMTLSWQGQVDPNVSVTGSDIINTATVSDDSGLHLSAQAITAIAARNLRLTKSAPYLIWPGQQIVYTVTVENIGQSTLYELEVRDPVAQYDLFPASISHNGELEGNTEIVWRLPTLLAGEQVDLTWQATIPPDLPRTTKSLKNEATVTTRSGLSDEAEVVSYLRFPELTLYKLATEESWPEGVISYTLVLDNNSPVPVYDVEVRDPVPDHLTVQQIEDNGYLETVPISEVIWDLGTIPARERRILRWSAIVDGNIPVETDEILNTASAGDQSGLAATAEASTVILEPELQLTKTGPKEIGIGQWVTYTLTVENVGRVPVREVTLIDPVPDYILQPSNISDQGHQQGNDIIWLIGDLVAGEAQTVTWSGYLDPTTPNTVTSLTNEASVQALPRGNDTAQVTSQILHPDIDMVKLATPAIGPGETIYYTLIVSNTGPIPIQQIEIQDPIPAYIFRPSYISNNGQVSNNTLSWTLDHLQPNEQRFVTWQGALDPTTPETITNIDNTATVRAWPAGGASASVSSIVHRPEIRLGKRGPESIAPGDQIAYTLAVTNGGPMTVQQVQINDVIPAYVLTPTNISDQGQIVGQSITWTISTLDIGEVRLLTWQGTVDPTIPLGYLTITNTAEATAWPAGSDQASLTTLVKQPVLSVTKQANPLTDPGGLIDYRITLHNEGETTIRGLRIEDILPPNVIPDQVDQQGYEVPGRIIWDDLDPLKPGDRHIVTWTGQVNEELPADVLTITNEIEVTAWGGLFQIAQAQTGLRQPTLSLSKNGNPSIHAGGGISYTILVRNQGPGIAHNVTVRDPLPSFMTYIAGSASNYGQLDGDELIWQIEQVAVGESQTLSWLGQVDLDLPTTVTTITNIATVTTSRHPVVTDTTITAIREPKLALQLQCPSYSQIGEVIQLQASLINDSPGTLRGLQATATISNGLQYRSGSASQLDLLHETPDRLIWDLDTLAASSSTDLQWQMQISPDTDLTQVETQLTLSSQDTPLLSQTCQTDLLSPSLSVTKSATGGDKLNDRIDYQVTVQNTGVVTAYQVVLTDTLPLGAIYLPGTAGDGATVNAQTIIWQMGDLGPNEQTLRHYQMESLIPTNIPTEAQLYDEQGQLIIHNRVEAGALHTTRVVTDIITLAPRPTFSLNKNATVQARPGDTITYTLTAINNGPGTARQVTLTDQLPDELVILEYSLTDGGFYDTSTHSTQWALGAVAEGTTISRQFQAIVPLTLRPIGQQVWNNASLYSPDIAPVYAQASTQITSTFAMAARKEASITTIPGGRIDYQIEVRNISPNLTPDVRVVDPLPEFTSYLEGSGSITPVYDPDRKELVWHLGVMAEGESRTIAFSLAVSETVPDWATQIVNEAQLIYPTKQLAVRAVTRLPEPAIEPTVAPPTIIDHEETVSVPVDIVPTNTPIPPRPPVVPIPTPSPTITPTLPPPTAAPTALPQPTLSKRVDRSVVIAGQEHTVTWALTFANPTPLTISNLVIEDVLPTSLVYLESSMPRGAITTTTVGDQTTLTAHLGDLSGGSSVTILIQTVIMSDTAPGTVVVNQASYTAQNIDPGQSNEATVTVQGLTLLPVTGGLLDPRTPGGQVTWSLTTFLGLLAVVAQKLGWLSLIKHVYKNPRNTDDKG
ncbi:MAG: Ig-like domain-containing protein [Chloroflexota bacterium]